MSDFTPGPWKIGNGGAVVGRGGKEVHYPGGLADYPKKQADTNLIVSAPDMYAEHKEWAEKFGSALMLVMQEDYSEITELAMEMRMDFGGGSPVLESKALAKARGEHET